MHKKTTKTQVIKELLKQGLTCPQVLRAAANTGLYLTPAHVYRVSLDIELETLRKRIVELEAELDARKLGWAVPSREAAE